jgi:DNA-binding beta-propeller fold protein YncE
MTQPSFDDAMGIGQGRLAITLDGRHAYLTSHIKLSSGGIAPNSLIVVDIAANTSEVLATAADGIFNGVALKPGSAYVSTIRGNKGEVTVINTQSNSIDGDPIQLGFGRPSGIAISSNGRAYVPDCFKSVVHVVDIAQRKVLPEREIPIDRSAIGRPARIAISSDGKTAFVATMRFANDTLPHKIVVVDTTTDTAASATISVGRTPIDIAAEKTGDRVYVVNRDSNSVTRIRRSQTISTTEIDVGAIPLGVAVGADGRILITSRDDETVTLVDADQHQVLAVDQIGPEPSGIAVSADGKSTLVAVNSPAAFATLKRPAVTGLDPTEGKKDDPLTVSGKHLSSPEAVTFGGKPAQIVSAAADRVEVKVPEGAVGVVNVVVTSAGGVSEVSAACKFTYLPVPVVTGVDPVDGKKDDPVAVSGSGLSNPKVVTFGGKPAQIVSAAADRVEVKVPEGAVGVVDVVVVTGGGESRVTAASKFTYLPVPVVLELSAEQGKKDDVIRVIGENLGLEPREVHFGNEPAGPGDDVGFGSKLKVTVPVGSGTVHVTVTTRGGTSEKTDGSKFTYV